ncbi:hypothetical protein [Bdellovibrio bacteriovorus]|uniref:Lipoprotein n=1 Tax=Bdellovibrio bacteriovorus str. Tiberius TaxID=1069642 RepID=K7ZEL9_BDEBC|nr:hypothetical protein [Bdellovibrio bacteriovorus]AFY00622.1 Hypothetical protein Bdt_0922 [Bdellovibrio bacteriovorus str. Tiberius]
MKKSSLFILALSASTILGACSFQKDPSKPSKVVEVVEVPKEVKVGMTKEEIYEDISKSSELKFPDKLKVADKLDDEEMFLKLLDEVDFFNVNEVGEDGLTALQLFLREDVEIGHVLSLLRKGASLYVPIAGTEYTGFDFLKKKNSEWNEVRSQLPFNDLYLYENTSFYSLEALYDSYDRTRFPMLKHLPGKQPLICQTLGYARAYRDFESMDVKRVKFFDLLQMIEKREGTFEFKDPFAFVKAAFVMEDIGAFDFFLKKLGRELNKEERLKLIETFDEATLYWVRDAHHFLSFSEAEIVVVGEQILKNVEKKKIKKMMQEIQSSSVLDMLIKKHPSAYAVAYDRIKTEEFNPYFDDECAACEVRNSIKRRENTSIEKKPSELIRIECAD